MSRAQNLLSVLLEAKMFPKNHPIWKMLKELAELSKEQLMSPEDVLFSGQMDDWTSFNLLDKNPSDLEAQQADDIDQLLKNKKSLEGLFKTLTGFNFKDFFKKILAGEKSNASEDTKPLLKFLSNTTTISTKDRDLSKSQYYLVSSKKLVIRVPPTATSPEAVVTPDILKRDSNLRKLKISFDEFMSWLDSLGLKKIKRPVRSKARPPVFD